MILLRNKKITSLPKTTFALLQVMLVEVKLFWGTALVASAKEDVRESARRVEEAAGGKQTFGLSRHGV